MYSEIQPKEQVTVRRGEEGGGGGVGDDAQRRIKRGRLGAGVAHLTVNLAAADWRLQRFVRRRQGGRGRRTVDGVEALNRAEGVLLMFWLPLVMLS